MVVNQANAPNRSIFARWCTTGILVGIMVSGLLGGCSNGFRQNKESGGAILNEEALVVDIGSASDFRISGASVTQKQLFDIAKEKNTPGLVLTLRLSRDVPLSVLQGILATARERELSEVRIVFTNLTIDQLTKPFETNNFLVID
jgi:hypothetical protein